MTIRVLVVGDEMRDEYHFCSSSRMCPEAPVPVLARSSNGIQVAFGGAALVRNNLDALGLDAPAILGSLSTKERYYVGGHMVCRVDADSIEVRKEASLLESLQENLPSVQAIVISDYCKGGVTEKLARACVGSGKPCFVDTKNSHISWYSGFNVTLFPNEHEYESHVKGHESMFGRVVAKKGERGCELFDSLGHARVSTKVREVRDVCGAGDVFIAAYVWANLNGASPQESAQIANEAAGSSVEHLGTYILQPTDVTKLKSALHETVSV